MTGGYYNRDGGVSRSVLILVVLLVAAVGALFLVRQRGPVFDFTLGGPLFPVASSDISGLLLTRQGAQYRLDQVEPGSWALSGAVSDYVDSLSVLKLLDDLTRAFGGPLLPGTDLEDRRYEFNGPEAIRLTVFLTDGEAISLALGTANPVAGNIYASGAGREACFMVSGILRQTLGDLPGSVQARVLLPGVRRDLVQRVDLRRGDRDIHLERREGRWWMLEPADGLAQFGQQVGDYHLLYDDRRITNDRGVWFLASSPAVNTLIYQASDIIVRDIIPPAESASVMEAWDLEPPWRRVTLMGEGLDTDPAAETPDRMVISFGPALDAESVPALRRGNVLVTDLEALGILEQPLDALLHTTALTFVPLQAAAMEVQREGRLLLRCSRTGVAATPEGRKAWLTEIPATSPTGLPETFRHGLSQDLVVELGRLTVLTVLPPTSDPAVLLENERVQITVTFGDGSAARSEVIEFGYLAEDRLPPGSAPLVVPEDGSPPVGLWFPAGGKLLQVPAQTIVTGRNLDRLLSSESSE